MNYCLLTCAGLLGVAPAFADRAQRASSSGPAQSLAGPPAPVRNTALSGCIPQASGKRELQDDTKTMDKAHIKLYFLIHVNTKITD